MSEERREFTRVFVHVRAEVSFSDGKKIQTESFDLSMKGISLEGGTTDMVGRECSINIALNAPPEAMQIKSTGVVAQYHHGRLGILFRSVEMESYEHLRNLVLYNAAATDGKKVEAEFQSHLGLRQSTESSKEPWEL